MVGKGVDLRQSRPGVQGGSRGPDEGRTPSGDTPGSDAGQWRLDVGNTQTVGPFRGPIPRAPGLSSGEAVAGSSKPA